MILFTQSVCIPAKGMTKELYSKGVLMHKLWDKQKSAATFCLILQILHVCSL